jgi:hypothetical protein
LTSGRRGALRLALLALLVPVLLAGCRVDTTVTIDIRDDGSGVVRVRAELDGEAVREAEAGGGKLEDRVRLGDLEAAGWTVRPWARRPDGGAVLVLTKPFDSAAQLGAVVRELNGEHGPVRGVRLTRDGGFLTTDFDLNGSADLSELTSGVLDDPEIVARLTAEQIDLPALDGRITQQLRDAFRLRVVVRFPDGTTKSFAVEPGTRTAIDASASELDATRAGLLVAAAVLGVLGLVILVRGEVSGSRRRRRRGSRRSTDP